MASYKTILVEDEGHVRTISLNRPEKRNALNSLLIGELISAFEDSAEGRCGVVILTGAGKAFCAGLDLEELQAMESRTAAEHEADSERFAQLLRLLYELPKPTIAAVNGPAIAGGAGLAMVCDFTLALPDATFGFTEVRIGFVPAVVSSFLVRQAGEKAARELLLTGRTFDAKEAHHLGLVTRLILHHQFLMKEAESLAQSLLRNSPDSLRWTKALLSEQSRAALDSEISHATKWNALARETDDFREGIRSFLEKRKPVWPSLC